jgi:DNA-binding Xre family transcriptional regulator
MKTIKKRVHRGSDFEDFLKEEGIFEEVEAGAIKKIIAYELELEMKKKKITQTKMAESLKTSRAAVKRILDPKNDSMTLNTLNRIAHALGKTLDIRFVDIKK